MSKDSGTPHIEGAGMFQFVVSNWRKSSSLEKSLSVILLLSTVIVPVAVHLFGDFLLKHVPDDLGKAQTWLISLTCVGLFLAFISSVFVLQAMISFRNDSVEFQNTVVANLQHHEQRLWQRIIEYLNWQPELSIEGVDMQEELMEGGKYTVWLTPHFIPRLFFSQDQLKPGLPYEHLTCAVKLSLKDGIDDAPFAMTVTPTSMPLEPKNAARQRFDLIVGDLDENHFGHYDPKPFALFLILQITENRPGGPPLQTDKKIQHMLRTVTVRLQDVQSLLNDLCLFGHIKRLPPTTDADPIFTIGCDYPYYASNLHLASWPSDPEIRKRLSRMAAQRLACFLRSSWASGAFDLEEYKSPSQSDRNLNSLELITDLCNEIRALVPGERSVRQSEPRRKIMIAIHETKEVVNYCRPRNLLLFSLIGVDSPNEDTLCLFDISSTARSKLSHSTYVASFSSLSEEALRQAARGSVPDASGPIASHIASSVPPPTVQSLILPASDELLTNPLQLASELEGFAESLNGKTPETLIIRPEGCFLNASYQLSDIWVSLPKLADRLMGAQALLGAFIRLVIRSYRIKGRCLILSSCAPETVLGDRRLSAVFQDSATDSLGSPVHMTGLEFENEHDPRPTQIPHIPKDTECICLITALDHDIVSYAQAFEKSFEAAGRPEDMIAVMIPIVATRSTHSVPFDVHGSKRSADVVPFLVTRYETLTSGLDAMEYASSPLRISLKA